MSVYRERLNPFTWCRLFRSPMKVKSNCVYLYLPDLHLFRLLVYSFVHSLKHCFSLFLVSCSSSCLVFVLRFLFNLFVPPFRSSFLHSLFISSFFAFLFPFFHSFLRAWFSFFIACLTHSFLLSVLHSFILCSLHSLYLLSFFHLYSFLYQYFHPAPLLSYLSFLPSIFIPSYIQPFFIALFQSLPIFLPPSLSLSLPNPFFFTQKFPLKIPKKRGNSPELPRAR